MKPISLALCAVIFTFFYHNSLASNSANWSKWRGPDENGISTETNWDPEALNEPEIKWSVKLGDGYSNVCIQDNYIYTMGNKNMKDTVFCLDFDTGEIVWKYSYEESGGFSYLGSRSTPVYSEGNLFTLSLSGKLFCFNAKTGDVIWQKNLIADYDVGTIKYSFSTSPYIYKNLIILNINKYGIALDKSNGQVVWKSEKGTCGYATPVLFSKDSKDYMAMFNYKGLYIVSPDTGKEHAFYRWENDARVSAADPIITDKGIFISSAYHKGGVLLKFTGKKLKKIWKSRNMMNHFSSSILIDGFLYGVSGSTHMGETELTCIDIATGKKRWNSKRGIEAVTAAGDKLLSITDRGELIISKVTPEKHDVISKAKVFEKRRGDFWTAPVLCRGVVFCRNSRGTLVSVNLNR